MFAHPLTSFAHFAKVAYGYSVTREEIMKKLSEPCSYRFFETQKAWIKKRAVEQGHGSEVVYLRQLVAADMQRQKRKPNTN